MEINNPQNTPKNSQRLETIGLMASGIAHDFNNLLTSIVGQTSLALANLPPENAARIHIERVVKAAEFGTSLTKQLLKLANDEQLAVEKVDISDFILNNRPLLLMLIDHNVQLVLELEPDLPLTVMIPSQIQQVIMNLVVNAVQAIGGTKGHIVIRTRGYQTCSGQRVRLNNGRALISGNYICIEVEDTGPGIDPKRLGTVFSRFYSTKKEGSGLGLTNSLKIVQQHNGGISLVSCPNEGTKVSVYLPNFLNIHTLQ